MRASRPWAALLAVALIACLVGGCSGAPILANPPAEHGSPIANPTPRPTLADPQPIVFPRDDGPHRRLTEWWYYTGHLVSDAGRRFGFEFVVFRAERGAFPVSWASHLALTEESGRRFVYDQRSEIGPQVDRSPVGSDGQPVGFGLAVTGLGPSASGSGPSQAPDVAPIPWTMRGAGGSARLIAASLPELGVDPAAAAFGLDLSIRTDRPAVLHDTVGYVDFGEAGGSYYYSRPRMAADGTVNLDSETFHVTGSAWFDHQWGDFISVGGGGWDWFAVNLADGTDVTLSLVRDALGGYPLAYGTLVHPDGTFEHLPRDAFSVTALDHWTSARTGTVYPAGWRVQIPSAKLDLRLEPTLADQELDTRPTTGVVYWEGSQHVTATKDGRRVPAEAYVELTGYAGATTVHP